MKPFPPVQRSTWEARLLEVLNHYRPIELLNSTVAETCESPIFKGHLQKILQHDLQVIKQRSQDLNDHEISLTQKAFVILMDEGDHIAGIEIYVEEIVGLRIVEDKERLRTLRSSVKTKEEMIKKIEIGQSPKTPSLGAISLSRRAREQRQVSEELFISDGSEERNPLRQKRPCAELGTSQTMFAVDSPRDEAPKYRDEDPKFKRLWDLYKTANVEFQKTHQKTPQRTETAKFLRDTIENCILYVESKHSGSDSRIREESQLDELRTALDKIVTEVEEGIGFKRRFDEDWARVPSAPRRMKVGPSRSDWTRAPSASKEEIPEHAKNIVKKAKHGGQYAREESMKTGPPPRGSYGGRGRAPNVPLYQPPTTFNHQHRLALPDASRQLSRRTHAREPWPSDAHRQRSASPHAPRQLSGSEQSRDRRRQDSWEGRWDWDVYRPRYS